MSNYERAQTLKGHEEQDIVHPKTKSLDVPVEIDINKDSKTEISNKELTENSITTDISAKQTEDGSDLTHLIIDDIKFDNVLEKENVQDIKENNEKCIESNTYITMRVYDTYYGQHHPQQPHQDEQFQRGTLYQQYQSRWGGGGGHYDGEPLTYDPGSRNYFVKLVFTIVLAMIVVTSAFIALVVTTDSIKQTFRRHFLLFFIVGLVLLLIAHYSIYLSPCARVFPCNTLILLLAIAAYCILAGNLSARYKTQLIFYAALATTAVVFVCLILACTKFDFTSWLLYVVVIFTVFTVISLLILSVVLVTKHYPKPLHIAMLVIGTLLQSVMLVIELQMILGGKSVELNENEYALGAYLLYTSILSLFMNLLQLIGLSN